MIYRFNLERLPQAARAYSVIRRTVWQVADPYHILIYVRDGSCTLETGGKQYRVNEGDILFIEKLNVEAEAEVTFDKVIAIGKEDGIVVGAPYVEGATVAAKALKNGKGKKITVYTYKPKKDSDRKKGHRQPYTQVRIEAINA